MIRNIFKNEKKALRESFHSTTENFVGIGLGDASNDKHAAENCIVIYVTKLTPKHKHDGHTFVDGTKLPVKYVEVGDIQLTGFTGRYRPAQPGAVLGAVGSTAKGTFGALVTDNTDGELVILSCSHVIAGFGSLPVGTGTLQPGPGNGGTDPADRIGTLKRVVPNDLAPGGINYVDVAISSPDDTTIVLSAPFCSSVKPTKHGAVGLLWSASSSITILNPISNVLSMMNVSVPKQKDATVGMAIHGCSAVTGYISTTVSGVMVDLLLSNIWFLDQVTCAGGVAQGTAGDSGTMFYTKFNV
jgi:hypothetical protein